MKAKPGWNCKQEDGWRQNYVHVRIRRQEGWYIATASEVDGLIVCSQKLCGFSEEIMACIAKLYELSHGIELDDIAEARTHSDDLDKVRFWVRWRDRDV